MPATANEKKVARAADDALSEAREARENIEFTLRHMETLERRYTLGKKMETWAPERLKALNAARGRSIKMWTGYHQLGLSGKEQLNAQRRVVKIRRITGTAHALVAAGKLAEVFIAGAKIKGVFEKIGGASKFYKGAEKVKTAADFTKDLTEAGRAAAAGKEKDAVDKSAQAALKFNKATRDFADIVDSGFAMAGLGGSKTSASCRDASELASKLMKATKALLISLREIERFGKWRAGADSKAIKAAADGFEGALESMGGIANIFEALMAIIDAIDEFDKANKLAEVARKQEAHNATLEGSGLSPLQKHLMAVALCSETGATKVSDVHKMINSRSEGEGITKMLNERYFGLKRKWGKANQDINDFSKAYSVHYAKLRDYYGDAMAALNKLGEHWGLAVKEQTAGGRGWRGAIGFLPERMSTEFPKLMNAITQSQMRIYR